MKSIALVIPYIGRLRDDFPFWMKSVEFNQTIDFFLLTDNKIENTLPNLHIINLTFDEINNKFADHFDFDLCISSPYKYCDLKPCYGEAFAELLTGYDFWGHTDMDMIYGDLRKYLTDEILDKFDKIFGLGHLSIYRNNQSVNSRYKYVKQPMYQQVFSFSEGCAFDEYFGVSKFWDENFHDKFLQSYPFDDIDCSIGHFEVNMRRTELAGKANFIYHFDNGKLYRISKMDDAVINDEVMYVHFQKRKMTIETTASDDFMMIPNRYIPTVYDIDVPHLIALSRGPQYTKTQIRLLYDRIRNKFRKLFTARMMNGFDKPTLPNAIKYYRE